MVKLKKLKEEDFDTFKSWIKNKDELFQFAGPIFNFPITDGQLLNYINDNKREVYKVIHTKTNRIIGNAELNFENTLPRLSRILVAKIDNRNLGFGKLILNKMLEILFIERKYFDADLNVFDWNTQAIKCYEKVGFIINPDIVYKQDNNGEIWTAINMTISKAIWIERNNIVT